MNNQNSQQLTIQKAISRARKATKQGKIAVAVELYTAVLQQQPNHRIAKKSLNKLQKELPHDRSAQAQTIKPSQVQIDALVNLYQTGQMVEAELACGKVLKSYPQSLAVINILGAALRGQGKLQKAVNSYNKAIQLKPDYAEGYYNCGNVLSLQGKLDEALQSYDKAIELKPDYAGAHYNRGNTLGQMGLPGEAIRSYDKAIELKPDYAGAHYNRGNALGQLGQLDEALKSYDKAIQLKPDYAEVHSNHGNTLKQLGQLDEALKSYGKAIQLKPDYAEAYYNRGNVLRLQGKLDEALQSYDKAIQLKPDYAEAYTNRGNVLEQIGLPGEAIGSYDKAIQLKPDFVEAYSNRGNALKQLGQMDAALEDYNKAIRLKPDFVEAHSNRGNALGELGQLDEAQKSYKKAIQLKPDYADAHRSLTTLRKYNQEDSHIRVMKNLLMDSALKELDRMYLYFALAKVYEDLGQYDDSFSCLEKANAFRYQELNYHIDSEKRVFVRIKEIFNAESLAPNAKRDSDTHIQPLFIIGMPRSGTSLVEQILASHSKVHGAGELEAMGRLAFPIISGQSNEDSNQGKAILSRDKIESLHNGYLETLTSLNVPETIFTDKMPSNFRFVGLILSALPKSKIIHVNRDPMATCWSNYKHFFSTKGNGYAYDMGNLAEFYNLYTDLMSFWHEQFPKSIYELRYENLTENQEEQSRKLLEFCELDWEEQCLNFYQTKRAVRTASSVQVRQKMYKGSSEAWRKYESHLQPLINGLKEK